MRQEKPLVMAALAACCLFAGTPLLAQEPPVAAQMPAEQLQELEAVVVYGGYAAPQMWKISKDGHVLWLLVIGNAPVGAPWRSEQLEARVAESQLVLRPAAVIAADYQGRLRYEAKNSPLSGKDTLKDVLPPDTYTRWGVLKTAYIGADDSSERLRPRAAFRILESMVMRTMPPPPPTGWSELWQLVDKAAKEYKVKVRTMRWIHPEATLTKAEVEMAHMVTRLDLDDVQCFTQGLDELERLIRDRDQPAFATPVVWPSDCRTDWLTSGKLPDLAAVQSMREKIGLQFTHALQQGDAEWMAAAQAALKKNKSTFAMQWIGWGRPNSYIAKFRELGYEVEEPGSVVE
jgi:hypothetical protein